MAHDGQDMTQMTTPAILPDLLTLTRAAVPAVEAVFERARESVRDMVSADGKISGALIEANQTAAHGLAWLATYNQSLQQMQRWAETLEADGKFGEIEQLLHQIAFGEYLHQVAGGIPMNQGEVVRLQDLGLGWDALSGFQCSEVQTLMAQANSQAARSRLVALMQDQSGATMFGASGLDEELEMIRDQFRRYAQEKVEPNAHDWHLKDELIPIEIIEELARGADQVLSGLGYDNVVVRAGDGYAGWPEHAPFDGIIVTAAAEEIPQPLLQQLKPGGKLVIPVGEEHGYQELLLVEVDAEGEVSRRSMLPVRFVPLTGER